MSIQGRPTVLRERDSGWNHVLMDIANVISLAISLIALATSGVIALRQTRLAGNANHLALVMTVLQSINGDLPHSEEHLRDGATRLTGPMSDLPQPVRAHAFRIAYEYQTLGYLSRTGIVDRQVLRHLVGVRVVSAWRTLAPVILAERDHYPQRPGFRFFEDLAADCADLDASAVMRRFRLRGMPTGPEATRPAPDQAEDSSGTSGAGRRTLPVRH
jgi:hypothetical protein